MLTETLDPEVVEAAANYVARSGELLLIQDIGVVAFPVEMFHEFFGGEVTTLFLMDESTGFAVAFMRFDEVAMEFTPILPTDITGSPELN